MLLFNKVSALLLIYIFCGIAVQSQSFVFAKLQGSPVNTRGWRFDGGAYVGNTGSNIGNNEVILTNNGLRTSGAVFYGAPINLAICKKWKAQFEFRIFEGNGADGIAFCYLENPPKGFVNGGGLGIPDTARGLKICIDTWYNECENQMPKLEIRWGSGYKECEPTMPTYLNSGALSNLQNGNYHTAEITYDAGNISFAINGTVYLTTFQALNFPGYFGFTASTGAASNKHSIRNVIIYTDMPEIDMNEQVSVCSGDSVQIGPNSNNPLFKYSWSPGTGIDNVNAKNPKVSGVNSSSKPTSTKYYLKTENIGIPGCDALDSVTIIVNPLPSVTVSSTSNCFQDTMVITPKTGWPDSITNTIQWNWIFGDPASGSNTAIGLVGRHRFSAPGNYNVVMNQRTREGCTQTTSQPVTVRSLPPSAFDAVNSGAVCINEPVKFVNRANAGATGSTSLQPDIANNGILFRYNKLFAVGDTISVNYRQAGVQAGKPFYVVKWSNTDAFGCVGSSTDTLIFRAQPAINMAAQGGVCLNVPTFNLNSATETSGLPGNGIYSGRGITNPSGTFSPTIAGIGTHRITYIYQAQNGCVDTAFQNFTVYALPVVNAGPDQAVLPGGYALLEGSSSIAAQTIVWSPAGSLSNPNTLRPQARPTFDQIYLLSVTTAQGCIGRDSVKVRALAGLTIPNAFSPHTNDAINDLWIIKNLDLFPGAIVSVFDRYGRQVFRSVGYSTPWDGKVNGILVPVGVYYFVIDPQNGNKTYAGSITIL